MNIERERKIEFYKALEKVMNIFKKERIVSKRKLRELGFCHHNTLKGILNLLSGEKYRYIINTNQKKKDWGLTYRYNDELDESDNKAKLKDPYYLFILSEIKIESQKGEIPKSLIEIKEGLDRHFTKEQTLRAKLLKRIYPFGEEIYNEREKLLQSLINYLNEGSAFKFEKIRHDRIREYIKFKWNWKYKIINPETNQIEEYQFDEYWEKSLIWNFRDLISKSWEDLSDLEKLVFLFFHYWNFKNPNPFFKNPMRIFMGSYLTGFIGSQGSSDFEVFKGPHLVNLNLLKDEDTIDKETLKENIEKFKEKIKEIKKKYKKENN